eukprot:2310148-Heterocapsa_arctica.AAC.1
MSHRGLVVELLRHVVFPGSQPDHLRQDSMPRSVEELGEQVRVVRIGPDLLNHQASGSQFVLEPKLTDREVLEPSDFPPCHDCPRRGRIAVHAQGGWLPNLVEEVLQELPLLDRHAHRQELRLRRR